MKKLLLIVGLAVFSATSSFAQSGYWTSLSRTEAETKKTVNERFEAVRGTVYALDMERLKSALENAPQRLSGAAGVIIELPNPEGRLEHYQVYEFSNFAPELQAEHPEIRSYVANGVEDPSAYLRFSVSPLGFESMVLRSGKPSEFIESYTTDHSSYIAFTANGRSQKQKMPFTCLTPHESQLAHRLAGSMDRAAFSSTGVLKTFRLALSSTAEYTNYFGGVNGALAAMNNTMTRVNGIFEKDLAVHLNIIANNSVLLYTNAASDPYTTNPGEDTDPTNWNIQLQNVLTTVIGEANYDIGHLFGRLSGGGGGNAGCIGCICEDGSKGSGYTAPSDGVPQGDSFDIDYVAHEMGHQLGATHTFSQVIENGTGTNVEPGSGSTIMSYAGIMTYNVQANSDDYFGYASLNQIQTNLQSKFCSVDTPITSTQMSINAGADYNIPQGTAFVLRAVGASANPAGVTYTWEQNDSAGASATGANSVALPTKSSGPLFRSIPPSASPNRYMPSLSAVLNGTLTTQWESVATVSRLLNFVLTGRNNVAGGGQTKSDAMRVTVRATAGPFAVTSQNTTGISWTSGSTQTITWNVAGTTANGINTSSVNILMSIDGGQTFPIVLAATTANDGTETITVPNNIAAPFCRIMVEAVNNIYYAVNSTPFAVNYTVTNTCNTFNSTTQVVIPDGTGSNAPGFGTIATSTITVPSSVTGTITDANVTVSVTHSYIADLIVGIVHPDQATDIYLWAGDCGSQDGFNVTFSDGAPAIVCANPTTGTFAPSESLAALNGKAKSGTWTLYAGDAFAGDTGRINSWSLELCTQSAVAGIDEAGLSNFALYPNPNNGNFTVEFTSTTGNSINIMMHDMRGRQVYTRSYQNTGLFSGNVTTSGLEAGVYLVTVQDGANKMVKRIVVE